MRPLTLTGVACLLLAGSIGLGAQAEFANNLKHDSGQDVQPVFEGWARVPNGSFDLYFGYLNRNWVQQLHIPVGPQNMIQPGGPDRGQPTFFYTRTNRKVFTVNVPSDFGKSELVWTLTANGRTRTVYGHLRPDWEITPDGGAGGTQTTKEARSNKPPTIALGPVGAVRLPGTATLIATVSDDGLPKPRGRNKPAVGQETPPGLSGGQKEAPANLPWLGEQEARRPDGLTVKWFVLRGPADVRFDPPHARPTDGRTTTTARFSVPGEYVLRGGAQDGLLTTYRDVSITVTR
jgi:hypothetical protein